MPPKFKVNDKVSDGTDVFRVMEVIENFQGFDKHAYQVLRISDREPKRIREQYLRLWPGQPGEFAITPDPEA